MKKISGKLVYFFGALGGLLFGYDTGVISGAILFIETDMKLTPFAQGIVVSAILFGAIMGAAMIGYFADRFGRKKMVLISAFIFAAGAIASALSPNAEILIFSRIILGVAVGGASALVPLYLAEMAPAKSRGTLSTLNQLMITVGILSAYIVNLIFADAGLWQVMLGFAAIPAIILFFGTLLLPESPRWLVCKGNADEAFNILKLLGNARGAKKEISEIKAACAKDSAGFSELFARWVRPALIVGVGLAIFQQLIGCNTVIYYAPTIFASVGLGNSSAILSTVGIGVVNVLVTIIALIIMDKFDRKKMLITGSIGMTLSLLTLGVFSNGASSAYLVLAACAAYIVFFALTWGPIMWIMIGEVFPLKIRGIGVGVSSVANWTANLGVALMFPWLLSKIGSQIFIIFAAMAVLSILFVKFKVIETRGRSLESIEKSLRTASSKK
ncbi:sugar porter family MFS transporter [Endomicrobium proavitum]|uniref:D-xylose-proton symporter n=1 Tax=Endomicrobium proavitum TaxID=1408281 RepID=A0A0G3WKV2_9BACT|nr:sugar porter family MFS transporter [Endomicrobium proavitum]AKL98500.1 D-xylose-proton symporter [Endomicrobium proavitum]